MNEVGLLQAFVDLGISVATLARECHCAPATIRSYLKGESLPTGSKQIAIREGLQEFISKQQKILE